MPIFRDKPPKQQRVDAGNLVRLMIGTAAVGGLGYLIGWWSVPIFAAALWLLMKKRNGN